MLPGYYQYFSGSTCKCVFAEGHNTAEVGIEPRPLAPESETLLTRPPRTPFKTLRTCDVLFLINDSSQTSC